MRPIPGAAAFVVLLELGAPPAGENRTGSTALHHAAEAGAHGSARFLLSAGAGAKQANAPGAGNSRRSDGPCRRSRMRAGERGVKRSAIVRLTARRRAR